tara:strand:- start:4 stop:162 length:159 start_codon:yes stop_codon:yes gene_type:complete
MKKPNFSNLAEFSDYKECGYNSAEEMRDFLELKWHCQPYEDDYEYDRSIDLI